MPRLSPTFTTPRFDEAPPATRGPGKPRAGSSRGARLKILAALLAALPSLGSACPRMYTQAVTPPTPALPANPTQEQVITAVNEQTARLQSLYTREATITTSFSPPLRASVALSRPNQLRLVADAPLTGPLVDLGSNADEFWFGSRFPSPNLYYCRHDLFGRSPAKQMIPVEPLWLIEALGVTGFSPQEQHTGPVPVGQNRLEMRSVRETADGPIHKITIVDATRAWILEQHLYDARGEHIASATLSDHRSDPVQLVTLPRRIELKTGPAHGGMSLGLDMPNVEINTLGNNSQHLWRRPSYDSWTPVDLGDPNVRIPGLAPPPTAARGRAAPGVSSRAAPPGRGR